MKGKHGFYSEWLEVNADKCHLLVHVKDEVSMKITDLNIVHSECKKRLGGKFYYKITFNSHVSDLCKNASRKINVLARVAPYMSISKRHVLIKQCFNNKSQFNYCPLVWMYHSRINRAKINRLQERCLRIIYNDKTSSLKILLEKDGSISIQKFSGSTGRDV